MSYKIKFLDGSTKEFDSLIGTHLDGADLRVENLSKANLFGADLEGANLYGADLSKANLFGTYLFGANLSHCKGIVTFQYNRHFALGYKYEGELRVKIECKDFTISEWLDNWREIGEKAEYSEREMKAYLSFIRFVKHLGEDGGFDKGET
jgi:hypothetical protein